MTLMLFSGAWVKMIPKKIWSQKSCDTVPLNVKSFVHIINNGPCEKDDNNLYLFYYIIRQVWYETPAGGLANGIYTHVVPV